MVPSNTATSSGVSVFSLAPLPKITRSGRGPSGRANRPGYSSRHVVPLLWPFVPSLGGSESEAYAARPECASPTHEPSHAIQFRQILRTGRSNFLISSRRRRPA